MPIGAEDFVRAMEAVARELLGEPQQIIRSKREWRYGSRGSFCVNLEKGLWSDFETGEGGGVVTLVMRERRCERPEAILWLQQGGYLDNSSTPPLPQKSAAKLGTEVCSYRYTDEHGAHLFDVVRFDPKEFRQRAADGTWKMTGVRRVPYRLPNIISAVKASQTVFIAEGEKGVEALERLGVTATCSPGGAGKWREEYNEYFRGARVVILPDNDPQSTGKDGTPRWHPDGRPVRPGQDHADDVAGHLRPLTADVRILSLPGLPLKGDVYDWIAAGGTREALEALLSSPTAEEDPPFDLPEDDRTITVTGNVVQLPKRKRDDPSNWRMRWARGSSGAPYMSVENAVMSLHNHDQLRGIFKFDEMEQAPVLVGALPGCKEDKPLPRLLRDVDTIILQEFLQADGLSRIGQDTVYSAMNRVADEARYHPLRDWLDSLEWDGEKRVYGWLGRYAGVEGSEYSDAIGQMFLIGMVARAFDPGCQMDYALVLEGVRQGERKSTLCRILGGQWFSDSLPDLSGDAVRTSMHLRGKWLIEISELSSFGAAENERVKAFITQRVERYIPKYGRREVVEQRQCVFIATTNETTYLKDATGARRYWPARITHIDTDALAADREQLFAEALHLYRSGATWHPDAAFEQQHIKPEQAARYEEDAWVDAIADWGRQNVIFDATLLDIARGALNMETQRLSYHDQRRIRRCLLQLGWNQEPGRKNGRRYHRPA